MIRIWNYNKSRQHSSRGIKVYFYFKNICNFFQGYNNLFGQLSYFLR